MALLPQNDDDSPNALLPSLLPQNDDNSIANPTDKLLENLLLPENDDDCANLSLSSLLPQNKDDSMGLRNFAFHI